MKIKVLSVDFKTLAEDMRTAVRFLDDAIDVNKYPLPEVELMHKGNRKIGLGIMGWADTLILLGIQYNSKRAFKMAETFMKFFRDTARDNSVALAKERGVFPNFHGSIYDAPHMPGLRNATATTIAPTGTLSIIADCSSGIEPLFDIAYERLIMDTVLTEFNKYFLESAKKMGFYSESLIQDIVQRGSSEGHKRHPAESQKTLQNSP